MIWFRTSVASLSLLVSIAVVPAAAQEAAAGGRCKAIHADLVEARTTTGCKPEHTSCFLGEVDGNHGLRGTTYFKGDSGGASPPTAPPGFSSYSGLFEYQTARGTIFTRETGVTNNSQGQPQSGVVTAFQQIVSATGEFTGATGYFFVSGFNRGGTIVTRVMGEICNY